MWPAYLPGVPVSGIAHEPETDWEEEEDEEEDAIAEWFMTSNDDEALVLHDKECAVNAHHTICDCVPVTLQRGAKA